MCINYIPLELLCNILIRHYPFYSDEKAEPLELEVVKVT